MEERESQGKKRKMSKEKGKKGREKRRQEKKKEAVSPSEMTCQALCGQKEQSVTVWKHSRTRSLQGAKENGSWLETKMPVASHR